MTLRPGDMHDGGLVICVNAEQSHASLLKNGRIIDYAVINGRWQVDPSAIFEQAQWHYRNQTNALVQSPSAIDKAQRGLLYAFNQVKRVNRA